MKREFDIFPNEIAMIIFHWLSYRKMLSIKGVCTRWLHLIEFTFMNKVAGCFPFLSDNKRKNTLMTSSFVAHLEKEEAIYAKLADHAKLPLDILEGTHLQQILSQENMLSVYSESQKAFLHDFAAASGVLPLEKSFNQEKVFLIAAAIGNRVTLASCEEKEISTEAKGKAFFQAAAGNCLSSFKYIDKKNRKKNPTEYKAYVFNYVMRKDHLPCVMYLYKQYGLQLSPHTTAMNSIAAGQASSSCSIYLCEQLARKKR